MSVAEWIRVGRIHTAALTMPITLAGYVLAGGRDPLVGLGWVLFGLLWHYVGFLQNNLFDLRYDRLDPEKQHFPLVRGAIDPRTAWIVDDVGLLLLAVAGALLSGLSPGSIVFLAVGIIAGTLYNAFSKRTLLKPIPIALCFASLPLIPYLSLRPLDRVAQLLFAFVFATIFYQIAYSGELKDIKRGERNILLALHRFGGWAVVVFAVVSKMVNLAIGYALLDALAGRDVLAGLISFWAASAIAAAIVLVLTLQLMDFFKAVDDVWDRRRALFNMSLMEILTYFFFVICIAPVLKGYALLWIALPVAWFVVMNRFIFGTTVYPRV